MGKILEMCQRCRKTYEHSEYDGYCSKACADLDADEYGWDEETCDTCQKKYLSGHGHACSV